jgi:hypothetical protein
MLCFLFSEVASYSIFCARSLHVDLDSKMLSDFKDVHADQPKFLLAGFLILHQKASWQLGISSFSGHIFPSKFPVSQKQLFIGARRHVNVTHRALR